MDVNIILSIVQKALAEQFSSQPEQPQQVAQITQDDVDQEHLDKIAHRVKAFGPNLTVKEYSAFLTLLSEYAKKHKMKNLNPNRLMRTVLFYFLKNWKTMDFTEIWKEEEALFHYRMKHKRNGKKGGHTW